MTFFITTLLMKSDVRLEMKSWQLEIEAIQEMSVLLFLFVKNSVVLIINVYILMFIMDFLMPT